MTLNEMIDAVLNLVQDPDGTRWTPDEITTYLNNAQRDFNIQVGMLRTQATLLQSANTALLPVTAFYDLPADLVSLDRVDLDGRELVRIELSTLSAQYGYWTSSQGYPYCYMWGEFGPGTIRAFPDPGLVETTLTAYYLRMPKDLRVSSAPEILQNYHYALVNHALADCYNKDFQMRNPEKAQMYMQMYANDVQSARSNFSVAPRFIPRRGF